MGKWVGLGQSPSRYLPHDILLGECRESKGQEQPGLGGVETQLDSRKEDGDGNGAWGSLELGASVLSVLPCFRAFDPFFACTLHPHPKCPSA